MTLPAARPGPAARGGVRRVLWASATVATLATLAGCAGTAAPPIAFHTLLPPAVWADQVPTAPAAASPAAAGFVLSSVSADAAADHPEWVQRGTDGSLRLLDGQRWAAPVADELRAALAQHLSWHWRSPDLSGLPGAQDARVPRIAVRLRRIEWTPGTQVLLQADWQWAMGPAGAAAAPPASPAGAAPTSAFPAGVTPCRFEGLQPAGLDAGEAAAALRRTVAGLAQQIAQSVRAGPGSGCAVATAPTGLR